MPTIPLYNSKQNIQAGTEAPLRNEAQFAKREEQQVVGVMQDMAQKWSEAQDVMQYTESKSKFTIATAQIENAASMDPNFNNSKAYYKRLEDAKVESLRGINNAQVRNKALLEFDYGSQVSAMKIDTQFRKKQLEHSQFVLDEGLDALALKKITAATSAEAQTIDDEITELINLNISAGVISQADGKKQRERLEKSSVQYAINTNPEEAKRLLTEGKFQYLSPNDRVSFLEITEKAIEQQAARQKRVYADQKKEIENALQDKFFNEDLTITDLEKASAIPEEQGGPDRGLLDRYRSNLYGKYKDVIFKVNPYTKEPEGLMVNYEKANEYIMAVDKVLNKETDLIKARKLLIDFYSDGSLNKTEAKALNKIIDISKEIEIDKASGLDKKWLQLQGAFTRLKQLRFNTYTSDKPVEEQAQDLKDFIKGISEENSDPNDILNTIIERRQKLNYPEFQSWEVDKTYETEIGTVKVIGKDADGMPIVEIKGGL